MSIKEALTKRNVIITLGGGLQLECTSPSALDLIEAIEFASQSPQRLGAWLVARHVVENGSRVWNSVDDVLSECDMHLVQEAGVKIESLYNQGKD